MNTDEENYRLFLSGYNEGFENIVIKYKDSLIYFLYTYVKDINEAEDLAQDTFVDIYVYKDRYNFKWGLKTYIYTIGRNKAIDFIRKNKWYTLADEISEKIYSEDTNLLESRIIKEENKRELNKALKKLKPDYQTIIRLIDFEELSYKDASVILHKTVPQIKVLIHRARKSLRKILEREGYVHEK